MVAASLMSILIRWALKRENARRDALVLSGQDINVTVDEERNEKDAQPGVMPPVLPGMEDYRDQTDKQIPGFRYSL